MRGVCRTMGLIGVASYDDSNTQRSRPNASDSGLPAACAYQTLMTADVISFVAFWRPPPRARIFVLGEAIESSVVVQSQPQENR